MHPIEINNVTVALIYILLIQSTKFLVLSKTNFISEIEDIRIT